jgi:hypothetical protein
MPPASIASDITTACAGRVADNNRLDSSKASYRVDLVPVMPCTLKTMLNTYLNA